MDAANNGANYLPVPGSLDAGFGIGGIVTTDVLGGNDFSDDGVIQIDPLCNCERFVILGVSDTSTVAAGYIL